MVANGQIDAVLLEESLEDLYENAPCGYISTLPDGTLVKVNQTFLNWVGYARAELLTGKRFQDLLGIQGKIYYETHYAPLLNMQGFVNEVAFNLICREGDTLPVLLNTVQKSDETGTPIFNRTTIFNATDRRSYERELLLARKKAEQLAEGKARFLSMLSHEIRNPLSSIYMATEFLETTECTPEQAQCVRVLRSSSCSLMDLITQILDYSRIEAGKVELDERAVDLAEFVQDLAFRMGHKLNDNKVTVRAEIDPRIPTAVMVDPVKLGQILTNLLGNAVKFTEKGWVAVRVQRTSVMTDRVCINFSVQDTGIGIAPDRLSAIFEEFTQASADTAFNYGGTGLGLAICQKLLHLYQSQMQVESTVGKGSTFSFKICLKTVKSKESMLSR